MMWLETEEHDTVTALHATIDLNSLHPGPRSIARRGTVQL